MDEQTDTLSEATDSLETLETPANTQASVSNPTSDGSQPASSDSGLAAPPEIQDATGGVTQTQSVERFARLKLLVRRFNVYLLLFVLIVISSVTILMIALFTSHSKTSQPISSQSLSASTLSQLATGDVAVGDPKQVLSVQSNAVFSGKVLIRDSLDVAGPLKIGGPLSLPGITVSGTSSFEQVQISKGLTIGGDSSVQGQLNVQKNINVSGSGTFSGTVSAAQLTTNTLQINGDFNLNKHITAGGPTPSRTNGSALGSGGSSSVSGSDSAGSITISTGSSPAAGCFITIIFNSKFNATPHILLTPVGAAAAGLSYYVTRTTGSFSVCTSSPANSADTFGFDYFVLD